MIAGKRTFISVSVLSLFILHGCAEQSGEIPFKEPDAESISSSAYIPPFSEKSFLYAAGWLDEQTLLAVLEVDGKQGIYSYDCIDNDVLLIRQVEGEIKYISLSQSGERIMMQVLSKKGEELLLLLDKSGRILHERKLDIGRITDSSWNPIDEDKIFLTGIDESNNEKYYLCEMVEGKLAERADLSALPTWYSQNLFLYLTNADENGQQKLMLADVRPGGGVSVINKNVLDYDLEGEAVVLITPSDFDPNELLMVYYYPILIDQGFINTKAVYAQSKLLMPELTIASDSSDVFIVMPKVDEENKDVMYTITQADFVAKTLDQVLVVEELSPIKSSPDGKYLLYGDSYQYIIDVNKRKLQKLEE